MVIRCPSCGARGSEEFVHGGPADVVYPEDPIRLDDAAWAEFLYYRDNRAALVAERWFHVGGCRRWFVVERDTATNRLAVAPLARRVAR